jgi:hypothetical protein
MIYSAFFMNNRYVRSALAAIVDDCEAQVFNQVTLPNPSDVEQSIAADKLR